MLLPDTYSNHKKTCSASYFKARHMGFLVVVCGFFFFLSPKLKASGMLGKGCLTELQPPTKVS